MKPESEGETVHTSAFKARQGKAMQRKVEVKISKQGTKYCYDDVDDDGTRAPTERLTYNLDRCTILCFMYIHLRC